MKVEVLFPKVCNLFGDPANISYIKKSVPDCEITATTLTDRPLFADKIPDLIYIGGMTEHTQSLVCEKLLPYRERIIELIENGANFLVTGNATEIFGKYVTDQNSGKTEEFLGIFDTYAKRDMMNRFNCLYIGKYGETDVVGFKTQFSRSFYGNAFDTEALFTTTRGEGFNSAVKEEGILKNNFMATYVVGPLLVLNPPFTSMLLRKTGYEGPLAFEKEATEAYNERVAEYLDPKTGLYY